MRIIYLLNKRIINYLYSYYWQLESKLKCYCLRLLGVKVGKNVLFKGKARIQLKNGSCIEIGDNCRFNSSIRSNPIGINHICMLTTMRENSKLIIGSGCGFSGVSITAFDNITIGEGVRVGANCVIMDGDFHLDDPRTSSPAPITIKDNVWLGYGVVVMKGVTIGENSVIGVNSIVTKDVPANVIAAGNPCKVIRSIEKV